MAFVKPKTQIKVRCSGFQPRSALKSYTVDYGKIELLYIDKALVSGPAIIQPKALPMEAWYLGPTALRKSASLTAPPPPLQFQGALVPTFGIVPWCFSDPTVSEEASFSR